MHGFEGGDGLGLLIGCVIFGWLWDVRDGEVGRCEGNGVGGDCNEVMVGCIDVGWMLAGKVEVLLTLYDVVIDCDGPVYGHCGIG